MTSLFHILAIGDPHFKDDNGEVTDEMTYKIQKYIRENYDKLDAVAVLGDILHRHEKINLHPLHKAIMFLESLHKALDGKWLYIIIGNHDRCNNRDFMTDEHAFNSLKKWKNTLVIDKATLHTPIKGFQILLMPYVPPGDFKKGYETVISEKDLETDVKLVLAHQEFYGAKMNTITSNEGDMWETTKPLCISGHIHDYDVLHSNMIYPGTPIQHGYSDHGKKTLSYFKINDDETFTEKRIDLKIKGRLNLRTTVENYEDLNVPYNKYYIKITVCGTKPNIEVMKKSERYKLHLSKNVIFKFLEISVIDVRSEFNHKNEFKNINFMELIEKSLDKKELDYLNKNIMKDN